MQEPPAEMEGARLQVSDRGRIVEVSKALASSVRLAILALLADQMRSVSEIAEELNLPLPTVSVNLQKLERAGLVRSQLVPARRGSQRICARTCDTVEVLLPGLSVKPQEASVEIEMPIGQFRHIDAVPTCGMASAEGLIGLLDDPATFTLPERVFAGLIWTSEGQVTYQFPNNLPARARLTRLTLSMEIASEAPNHHPNWPSDITLWIEGVEVGTWTAPGDFGGTRGRLTPSWWLSRYSQYGLLKTWTIGSEGSFIDGVPISDVTVHDLPIQPESRTIEVRFGNRPDARHRRGFNLFGRSFGNYPQDLILRLDFVTPTEEGTVHQGASLPSPSQGSGVRRRPERPHHKEENGSA